MIHKAGARVDGCLAFGAAFRRGGFRPAGLGPESVYRRPRLNPARIYQGFKNGHARGSRHVLIKPLDSGFRRAAPGIVPSRRIQDFLPINDGEARIKAIRLPVCVYHFVVIPACLKQAGESPPTGSRAFGELSRVVVKRCLSSAGRLR